MLLFRKHYPLLSLRPSSYLNNGIDNKYIKQYRIPYIASLRDRAIVFCGRFTNKSNLSLLIDSLPSLHNVDTVHIIGEGDLKSSLIDRSKNISFQAKLVWHDFTVNEKYIASIFNSCRLYVYPGDIGLSLIHAMNYGLPCVVHSSFSKHMPEITAFRDSVTGFSFTRVILLVLPKLSIMLFSITLLSIRCPRFPLMLFLIPTTLMT